MTDFRRLSPSMLASPQISAADVAAAKEMGVTLIVNNRPDGEAPDEPQGQEIEAAAHAAQIDYLAIPIGQSGFSEPQVEALTQALASAEGEVLGYCRSGTRSTFLWSLAQARAGIEPEYITNAARKAGYDVTPIRPMMDMFAARSS